MIHEYSIHAGYLGRVAGRGAHGVIVCRYLPYTYLVYQSDVNLLLKFLANANIILIDKGYKILKCLLLQCHR